eukprot:scaffold25586_cov20-Tisochrysis_lutea.AAC.4
MESSARAGSHGVCGHGPGPALPAGAEAALEEMASKAGGKGVQGHKLLNGCAPTWSHSVQRSFALSRREDSEIVRPCLPITHETAALKFPLLQKPHQQRLSCSLLPMQHAGAQVVLTSAQQVSQLLYKQLKIPVPTIATKYKSGDYSVNKDDLEEIKNAHPVVPIIQEHRRISKQLSLLQGLVDQVCQVDAHARATAEACAAMLAGLCRLWLANKCPFPCRPCPYGAERAVQTFCIQNQS